jgi:hypothetical protein
MCERMASEVAPRDAWVFAGFPAWPPVVKERAVVSGDDVVKWLDASNDDDNDDSHTDGQGPHGSGPGGERRFKRARVRRR